MIRIKKKTGFSAAQEDLLVDLTLHGVPASLIAEFAEKIVRPYYGQLERCNPRSNHKSPVGTRVRSFAHNPHQKLVEALASDKRYESQL